MKRMSDDFRTSEQVQASLDRLATLIPAASGENSSGQQALVDALSDLRNAVNNLLGNLSLDESAGRNTEEPAASGGTEKTVEFPFFLLDEVDEGFVLLDGQWRLAYGNRWASEMVARPLDELLGKNLWEEFPKLVDTPLYEHLNEVMKTGLPARFQMRSTIGPHWYEVSAFAVQKGTAVHWHDVSEEKARELVHERQIEALENARMEAETAAEVHRKAAEESRASAREARRSTMEMETLLDNLADAVMVFNREGYVQRVNAYAVAMLGFEPGHMHYRSIVRRLMVSDEANVLHTEQGGLFNRAKQGEVILNLPVKITNRRKRLFNVLVSALPLYVGKAFNGVVIMLKDITQREALLAKNLEQSRSLDRQRVLLEQVINEAPVGIVVLEGPDHRIAAINPYFQTEISNRQGVLGQRVADAWPEVAEQITPLLNAVHANGQPFMAVDARFSGETWGERYLTFSLTPLFHPNGGVNRILVMAQDTSAEVKGRQQREAEQAERRRMKRALLESQERLVLATEAAEIGAWQRTFPNNQVTWDARTRALFGLAPDTPISYEVLLELMHPDDRQGFLTQMDQVEQNFSPYEKEYRIIRPDGSVHWLFERGQGKADETGKLSLLYGVVMDITARKEAEAERGRLMQQVEAEHARLDAVLQELPVSVWIADKEGRVLRNNTQAIEVWAEGPVLPTSIQDYGQFLGFWPESGERLRPEEWPLARALLHGERLVGVEIEIQRFDGERATLLISAAPIRNREGEIVGGVAVEQDITDRKQAEQRLRVIAAELSENEMRLRIAMANAPITLFSMDANLAYTWIHTTKGKPDLSWIIGKRDDMLLPLGKAVELTAFKQSVMESNTGMRGEFSFENEDGQRIVVLYAEPLRNERGEIFGLTGAALDITEQRRLEAEHIKYATAMEVQRHLLEQREMERQRIAREIHDGPIQNMIGVLFHLSALQDMYQAPELEEPFSEVRKMLQGMVNELRSVCNELRPPTLMQFGLERAIRNHASNFRERYPQLKLYLDLMDDGRKLPERMRLALFRIYQEGVANVLRHATATQVVVRFSIDEERVVLEIEDNGRGFETPLDWAALARDGHLGLVGMKERAESTGGEISVSSKPKAGTVIRVEIPLVKTMIS